MLTKIPVETCKLEIFVSAFVKSATLHQFEPFQRIIFLFVNELTTTSVHAFIEQLEIYVGDILFHLLNDELYYNN